MAIVVGDNSRTNEMRNLMKERQESVQWDGLTTGYVLRSNAYLVALQHRYIEAMLMKLFAFFGVGKRLMKEMKRLLWTMLNFLFFCTSNSSAIKKLDISTSYTRSSMIRKFRFASLLTLMTESWDDSSPVRL